MNWRPGYWKQRINPSHVVPRWLYLALRAYILRYAPRAVVHRVKRSLLHRRRQTVISGPVLDRDAFRRMLAVNLKIGCGRVVFVHSSVDLLNCGFRSSDIMELLRDVVGPDGTLVFPTFPAKNSLQVLQSGMVFDSRRTPGYSGILGEMARRQPGAVRSIHPTRSVVAIGPAAEWITARHHESMLPCDELSPFYRMKEASGQIVGLGVSTRNLTFVHTLDDVMPSLLPFEVYHRETYAARCIDAKGREVHVRARAHDLTRMRIDVADFIHRFVDSGIAEDLHVGPMEFFRAEAAPLFDRLLQLARAGITIYRN